MYGSRDVEENRKSPSEKFACKLILIYLIPITLTSALQLLSHPFHKPMAFQLYNLIPVPHRILIFFKQTVYKEWNYTGSSNYSVTEHAQLMHILLLE